MFIWIIWVSSSMGALPIRIHNFDLIEVVVKSKRPVRNHEDNELGKESNPNNNDIR